MINSYLVEYLKIKLNLKNEVMGHIDDSRNKRKDTESDPLKKIGNRNIKTNKVDFDEKSIKNQQNK
jgi:hypothetical protein